MSPILSSSSDKSQNSRNGMTWSRVGQPGEKYGTPGYAWQKWATGVSASDPAPAGAGGGPRPKFSALGSGRVWAKASPAASRVRPGSTEKNRQSHPSRADRGDPG